VERLKSSLSQYSLDHEDQNVSLSFVSFCLNISYFMPDFGYKLSVHCSFVFQRLSENVGSLNTLMEPTQSFLTKFTLRNILGFFILIQFYM